MKRLSATLVFTLIIGVAALAYGKGKPLADQQMDRISAGSAIADGESNASDTREFEVELSGSALNGASAVNIVNAANSTVANGVNVWSAGSHDDSSVMDTSPKQEEGNGGTAIVLQTNTITQTGVPCDCGSPGEVTATTVTKDETEVDTASGNAIALDGSTASNKVEESIGLSGSAEANAKAVNIVNAAGSLVANGVNVASSDHLSSLILTQVNVITQSAH